MLWRVDLRKYLNWCDEPGCYLAKNVTPLEWAAEFPERRWVSKELVGWIEKGNE